MAKEQETCTVFQAREVKSFNFRVNNSATKHLAVNQCIDTDVSVPAAAGFKCTAKYWPHWRAKDYMIKIALVITRTDGDQQQQRPHNKVVAASIDLPARTGYAASSSSSSHRCETSTTDRGGGVVSQLVVERSNVETNCIVDDHFTAICMVAVSKVWPPLPLPTASRLDHDIFMASDLTDVVYQVEDETFRAHRLVLAARSPVFKAQLFGHMAESQPNSSVVVRDVSAATFKSMLHYMYHGSLPAVAQETETAIRMMEIQDLCVAADKYALDTLKQTCEEILCASVSKSTVLLSLDFAEKHACLRLKSRCLDFLAVPENFKKVAVTNEYIELMKGKQCLLDQVQNWFKRPRLS